MGTSGGFLGSYSDFKLIKTRSMVQVIIEVPIERAKEVTDLLGLPLPGEEVMVAVARIDATKLVTQHPRAKLSQIAGILCNEGGFNAWASEHGYASGKDYIYDRCTVASRRELDTDEQAALRFRDMRADYDLWLKGAAA